MNTDQTLLSHWNTQDEELEQLHFTAEEHSILKGSPFTTFEFAASMRLRHTEENRWPEFGILLQYGTHEKMQIQFIKRDESWKLAVTSTGMTPVVDHVLTLPAGFKAEQWHTLRVRQQEEQVHLFLDDTYVLVISDMTQAAQPGLITHNAAADFADIQQRELEA